MVDEHLTGASPGTQSTSLVGARASRTPLHQHARMRLPMAEAMPFNKVAKSRARPERVGRRVPGVRAPAFELSSKLANLAGDEFEAEIQSALSRIREFLGFDRSSFADSRKMVRSIFCARTRSRASILYPGTLPPQLAWYHRKLLAGEMVVLQSLPDDLPPEAVAEADYVRSFKMRSQVTIPFRISGRIVGMIAFGAFRETRIWPVDLIARIRLIGKIFADALARKRSDEMLAAALTEVSRLKERLEQENAYLRQVAQIRLPHGLTSHSPRFKSVIKEIGQVAQTNTTVLLLGETGSGKEVLAQAIHDASTRKDRAMVKVNCAALPATLIESELFGRERPLPAQLPGRRAALRLPTARPSFLMKSVNCRSNCSRNCCALKANSNVWAVRGQSRSMSVSLLRRTETSRKRLVRENFGRICSIGLMCSRSNCQLYGNAPRTFRFCRGSSSRNSATRWANRSRRLPATLWQPCRLSLAGQHP